MFKTLKLRKCRRKHGGNDREIFRHVVGDGKSGERAARDQQLFANFNDLNQLRWIGIEVHHVAGFFGGLRSGVHGDANIGLRQRGRIVGAVAGHGDEFPFGLLVLDQRHFVFGLGFGKKIVHAGLPRDGRGGQRIVASDHHGANAHRAQMIEAFAHSAFYDVR